MIVDLNDLSDLREKHNHEKIVLAGGTFDVFHPTHVKALKSLRDYGDIVVIGIVSDERTQERKGRRRPILKSDERIEIVDAIKYVDYTVKMPTPDENQPFPTIVLIEELCPDIFVSVDKKWNNYRDQVEKNGTKLKLVDRIHPTSSTKIIERILQAYCDN